MDRRKFTKLSALGAVAVSTTGFVRYNGSAYEGDCQTTTDILGPFYRPDSPVRDNLVIEGMPGELVELTGVVRHKDCTTPFKGAKVELWHCSADEVYDNESDEFRYRGTTYCDDDGNYSFTTQMPVPYDAGGGNYRPAHFHMMISAPGIQSLVTQVYFTGDPYLSKDTSSASPRAKNRILEVQQGESGKQKVLFDISLIEKPLIEPEAIDKLVGIYEVKDGKQKFEVFRKNNQLWIRNEVFGYHFDYVGKNTFEYPGTSSGEKFQLKFKILKDGGVRLIQTGRGSEKIAFKQK